VSSAPRTITILGPQRRPTLDQVVGRLDGDAPIAMITAGWQEREPDDAELDSFLGGRGVRLGLHARWMDVLERDVEFAAAELVHRAVLDEMRLLYLTQLDHALRSLYTVSQRADERPRTRNAAVADALDVVRLVDQQHVARIEAAHGDFYAAWRPEDRPVIADHREQVRGLLEATGGLVVAGGHVGELVRVLHLFQVAPFLPDTVVAWSAGAMALTERVVLFHDRAAHGPSHAEVYDEGIGLVPGVVFLPHARRRLLVDDHPRMSVLAARFAPATCVVLDDGMRLELGADGSLPTGARLIAPDGRIRALEPA
jgi:hypothetical protein